MAKYDQRLDALEQRCSQGMRVVWVATDETPEEATVRAAPMRGQPSSLDGISMNYANRVRKLHCGLRR